MEERTETAETLAKPVRRRRRRHRSGDRGVSFIEILVTIVLLGTTAIATLAAVRATVISTTVERDHSKAQQWLQSATGVIIDYDFLLPDCVNPTLDGPAVQAAYQTEIDNETTQPYGFAGGTIDVLIPEVWDGTSYVPFASQTLCYDDDLLRQQLVTIEVTSPNGRILESVEVVKRDR